MKGAWALIGAVALLLVAGTATAAASASSWPPHPPSCWSSKSGRGGQDCLHHWGGNGTVPNITVYTGAPKFIKQVKNGKLHRGGSGEDTFNIVHLWSSDSSKDNFFEMGEAYGQLLPQEFETMFASMIPWLEGMLEAAVPWLPKALADLVLEMGAPFVLDLLKDIVKEHIPAKYYQEWQGIAAGCDSVGHKCTVDDIARVSLFAQISKAACTAFVANDASTAGGTAMHLRALDFNASSHVADYSTLTVYHYNTKPAFANFGYSAMTDCLSCSNDVQLSIGEKKWGGHNTLIPSGLPWQMMMREAMELTKMAQVKDFIQKESTAPNNDNHWWPWGDMNTVSIHIVVSDGVSNEIAGAEVGYNYSKWFKWDTITPTPTHPDFKGIIYWPKNSNPHTMCPADMITSQYGKIDADWMANYYAYGDMTGDTQIVAWNHVDDVVYYANSRKTGASGPLCAYFRQRTKLDMKALYAEKRPAAARKEGEIVISQ
jgi:hypothetical protein